MQHIYTVSQKNCTITPQVACVAASRMGGEGDHVHRIRVGFICILIHCMHALKLVVAVKNKSVTSNSENYQRSL